MCDDFIIPSRHLESQVDDDEKRNEETFSSDWELDFEERDLTSDEGKFQEIRLR